MKGNEKLTVENGLRFLVETIVDASESTKDCGKFPVFGTFLQYFFGIFRGHVVDHNI